MISGNVTDYKTFRRNWARGLNRRMVAAVVFVIAISFMLIGVVVILKYSVEAREYEAELSESKGRGVVLR